MYCPQCGREYSETVNYCCHCGAAICGKPVSRAWSQKQLTRSKVDRRIAGVCGGFAEYLELDSTVVRLIWLLTALFIGWGFLAYLIAWIVMPDAPATQDIKLAVPTGSEPAPSRP